MKLQTVCHAYINTMICLYMGICILDCPALQWHTTSVEFDLILGIEGKAWHDSIDSYCSIGMQHPPSL